MSFDPVPCSFVASRLQKELLERAGNKAVAILLKEFVKSAIIAAVKVSLLFRNFNDYSFVLLIIFLLSRVMSAWFFNLQQMVVSGVMTLLAILW